MRTRTVATCQSCGAQTPKWVGRCPDCGEWGSMVEEPVGGGSAPRRSVPVTTTPLVDEMSEGAPRMSCGLPEVDRVLGGGVVAGSVTLLAGEPGVGKSTLALQIALQMGRDADVLLVCGEEAPQQVRSRAVRLGTAPKGISTLTDPSIGAVLGAMEETGAPIVIVDSIQTLYDPELSSAPGSVAQVRECGARLARAARELSSTVICIGHVTKDGAVAGPRVLEHLVDAVVTFEGDRSGTVRILRPLKNRFGSTQEVGFFEMTSDGLQAIRDASGYLLADRYDGLPGSVLGALVDGQRPFVCEIQALVNSTNATMPRRTAIGIDGARLPLLVAVVQRRLHLGLGGADVYVSAVGGIRVSEPAGDLPVVLALVSAWKSVALPGDVAAFGEVGLAGEVRRVVAPERRLAEMRSVGCRRVLVPDGVGGEASGLELIRVRHVRDAMDVITRLGRQPE